MPYHPVFSGSVVCTSTQVLSILCAYRTGALQQCQAPTEHSRASVSWRYAAGGAIAAGIAGNHVAHAEAEVHAACHATSQCHITAELSHHACTSVYANDSSNIWKLQVKAHVTISDPYAPPAELKGLPREIILYQYEVCPFCCKLKAFLDYHKVSLEQIVHVH